ncbi:MAG: hypothetical protein J6Y65_01230 [Eggerthellaceae bacterium]|nr:hypothetical protein [Eggerthellaceae bacterium]
MDKTVNPYVQSTKILSIIAIVFASLLLISSIPAIIVSSQAVVFFSSVDLSAFFEGLDFEAEFAEIAAATGLSVTEVAAMMEDLVGGFSALVALIIQFVVFFLVFRAIGAAVALAGAIMGVVNASQPAKLKSAKVLDIIGAILTGLTGQILLLILMIVCAVLSAKAKKFEDTTPKFEVVNA